jgi:hypothetical protein
MGCVLGTEWYRHSPRSLASKYVCNMVDGQTSGCRPGTHGFAPFGNVQVACIAHASSIQAAPLYTHIHVRSVLPRVFRWATILDTCRVLGTATK